MQLIARTKVNFFCPICTAHLEIDQESCGFARNPIKLRRFVVLTLSRRVQKVNLSIEVRMSKFSGLSSGPG